MKRLPSRRFTCNDKLDLHWKIRKKKTKMPSAEYTKRLLQGLKYGYISFDKGDRTGQAEMYLHCSDRGLDG